jgi:flavodoxin
MKRIIGILVLAVVVVICILVGIHNFRVSVKNKQEMAQYAEGTIKVQNNFGRVLVVYFSLTGNTKTLAEKIQVKTGADIYKIKTVEELKPGIVTIIKILLKGRNAEFSVLTDDLPDMNQYDMIFVGSPVWGYTIASPLKAFLREVDFQGKKIALFSSQGSNIGSYYEDFIQEAQNAEIISYQSFNNLPKKYDTAVDNKISVWLNKTAISGSN